MLKFFVVILLVCRASSERQYYVETVSVPSENYDDLTTTTSWPPVEYPKKLRVDDGYKEIKGLGSYKVYRSDKTWDEANDICKSDGGNLIVIRTSLEAIKVAVILEEYPYRNYLTFWLGLHQIVDAEQHLTWKTSLGEDLTNDFALTNVNGTDYYSRLVFGPSEINIAQCGLLLRNLSVKISAPCKYAAPFICKREPIN